MTTGRATSAPAGRGDAPADPPTAMDNATGKRLLALVRDGDYAHPGEEEANRLLFAGLSASPARRVLDAGCGAGGTAAWVQAQGLGAVTGVEVDPATARLARERHPEVTVVEGDLQAAGRVLAGPFDLIYAMTAIYAVGDQAAAFRELAMLAAPDAELRLLEYSAPEDDRAGAFRGGLGRGRWRPLRPRELPTTLDASGWTSVRIYDLRPEFVLWYRRLSERIAARRAAIVRDFGAEWHAFVADEYAGMLEAIRAGGLGGILVRARRGRHLESAASGPARG